MIGCIIRESDGRFMFYGTVENKASLWDVEANAPKPGFALLQQDEPPPPDLRMPWWDGSQWQATPITDEGEKLDALDLPNRVRAALLVRASSHWQGLSAARKQRVQAIIDAGAAAAIEALQ